MEDTLRRLASSSGAPVVWNLLAATTVAILLLCLVGLRCRLLRRYRLGSLLILRWICLADLCFVLHRAVFLLLSAVISTALLSGKMLITWTCKLHQALEPLLMLVQSWLLVLLAMERATMKLWPHAGLRYFSRLRLRVGVAISGILAFSLHINYIYVFAPVTRPASAIDFAPGPGEISNLTMLSMLQANYEPQSLLDKYNATEDLAAYQVACSVDYGFEAFYNYAKLVEILLCVYLPVLIVNTCVLLLSLHCAARGFTRLSSQQAARLLPPGTAGDPRARSSLARFNNTIDLLFLGLSLCSYVPMESIGIYKAVNVHASRESLLFELLNNMFLPAKSLLDALLIGSALVRLLLVARLGCPTRPKPPLRSKQIDCGNGVSGEDSAVRCGRQPVELEELNRGGDIV